MMSDQHNAGACGYAGHDVVQTPNLDALAAEGISFTQAYCNNPICSPSRMSFITGQYVHTHGYMGNHNAGISASNPNTLAYTFKENGYETALIGKSHTVPAWDRESYDFIRYNGFCDADPHAPLTNHYFSYLVDLGLADHYVEGTENRRPVVPEAYNGCAPWDLPYEHSVEHFTGEQTLDFLRHRDPTRPFFAFTSFLRPHDPYTPSPEYFDLYNPDEIILPDNITDAREGFAGKPAFLQDLVRDSFNTKARNVNRFAFALDDGRLLRRAVASYYSLISENDFEIGRIIAYLKDEGLYDNTIIVYTSDHGDFAGDHGLMGKCFSIYDAIHRIPLIVRVPGCAEGLLSDAIVESVDLFPTLCELTGVPLPPNIEGHAIIEGQTINDAKTAAFCEASGFSAIRTRDFRFIYHQHGEEELYDYRTDPGELHNVSRDPAYADVKQDLLKRLLSFTMQYAKRSGPASDRQAMRKDEDSLVALLHKKGYRYSQLADRI
jgi:choline-sulfatase/uncharacterized sulfatase